MKMRICFLALFTTTLACACAGSCTAGATTSGAGGDPTSGTSAGTGGDADAGKDHLDAPADEGKDAVEEPWGEAGWKPVGWAAPCAVEVAENPGAAVPALTWDPCPDGGPGCEQVRLDWEHPLGDPLGAPSVVRWGAGYRVGAMLFYLNKERRSVIYDVDGKPLVAWRTNECSLAVPMLTPSRAWVGAQKKQSGWIVETYEKLATATVAIEVKFPCQGYAASDDVLGLGGVTGNTMMIYDRLAGSATIFGPLPGLGYYQPYPVNQSALMQHFPEFNRAEGWIWNHATNTTAPLIQPGSSATVADIKSDGTTLVWVEAKIPTVNGFYPSADLWVSPFVTEKGAVVATKLRALPGLGEVVSHASDGYYALYAFGDKSVHVYRLSDGRHWSFQAPASSSDFRDVSYIDKHFVWYKTFAGVYRQSLEALGPGDPAP